jgi:hypothetical protein
MKKIWMLLVLILLLTACQEQETSTPTETPIQVSELKENLLLSPYVSWYGRHAYQSERVYFYHTATGFKVEFYGRVVMIELLLEQRKSDIYYSVAKNGEDLLDAEVYIQTSGTTIWTIEFDTFDHHFLEIVKRSEPEDGVTSLIQISTNGYFLEVEKDEQPHFLIIGASGISGHGALGSPGQPRTTANSSSLHSFGYLTAKAFNGSYEFVSSSGWGLLFGYNDLTGTTNIQTAYGYVGINPARQVVNISHDHTPVPDYIIINIGGNDYTSVINQASGFDRTTKIQAFKAAVAEFILRLRADAPEAHIIWTMTSGSLNGNAANEVIQLLDPIDQAYVHMVIIKQVGEDGDPAGANGHASFITHQKSAENIISLIDQLRAS